MKRLILPAMALLLAVSLSINILAIWRLRTSSESEERLLPIGRKVMPLEGEDLSGRHFVIDFKEIGVPTVVYVFKPSCPWCKFNEPRIKDLTSLASAKARFIAVSTSSIGLEGYVQQHRDLPIYGVIQKQTIEDYGIEGTPQTIVVGPSGEVLANWVGGFQGDVRTGIEKFFSVRLPLS